MTQINYINKKTNLINYLLNNIIKNLMIILYKDDILIFCIILSLSFLISLKIKIKTRKIRLKKNIILLKDTFIIESLIHSLKELDKNNQYIFYLNVK